MCCTAASPGGNVLGAVEDLFLDLAWGRCALNVSIRTCFLFIHISRSNSISDYTPPFKASQSRSLHLQHRWEKDTNKEVADIHSFIHMIFKWWKLLVHERQPEWPLYSLCLCVCPEHSITPWTLIRSWWNLVMCSISLSSCVFLDEGVLRPLWRSHAQKIAIFRG